MGTKKIAFRSWFHNGTEFGYDKAEIFGHASYLVILPYYAFEVIIRQKGRASEE